MSRRRQFFGVDHSFFYLKGRGHNSCVPTSMSKTSSMLVCWTFDITATTRN